ncbi:helix-turn-helix transcriptional regulator [Zafaria sp. Z1313]|uniref:helix-turn-helix transcriptional regulator n=1 Tax=Zafaria sp. Z1313 TaxID=3423202 RepID=UPI003D303BB5
MKRTARLRTPGDIGLAIQQSRLAQGMTQTDLARALDVSQSAISEIESGKSTIHLQRVLELARLTGLDLTASWEDDDAPGR